MPTRASARREYRPRTISWAAVLFVLLLARPSVAAEAFSLGTAEFDVGPNYGFYIAEDEEIPDTNGPGAHLTGGYTLSMAMYLGGEANYFVGRTETVEYEGVVADINWTVLQFGAELGYDWPLASRFILRPKLGLGYARITFDVHADDVLGPGSDLRFSDTYGGLVLPLGLDLCYALGERWLLATKFRYGYTTITVDVRDQNLQKVGERDQHAHGVVLGLGAGMRF